MAYRPKSVFPKEMKVRVAVEFGQWVGKRKFPVQTWAVNVYLKYEGTEERFLKYAGPEWKIHTGYPYSTLYEAREKAKHAAFVDYPGAELSLKAKRTSENYPPEEAYMKGIWWKDTPTDWRKQEPDHSGTEFDVDDDDYEDGLS